MTTLCSHVLNLRGRLLPPLMSGGMGTNISTDRLALAIERLGGIAHVSDAEMLDVCDRMFGTRFTASKAKRLAAFRNDPVKTEDTFDLAAVREATTRYVSHLMERATGKGLLLINCMEKLTMNAGLDTLKTRLNAALDAGIGGITLAAGLHLSSFRLMADNRRFHDALLGIIVSSSRALNLFLRKSASTGRLPDYIVVEGPLAGGHLGFGMDWAQYSLPSIVREVKNYLAQQGLSIPVIAAGGVFTGGEAVRVLEETGAEGIQAATRFAVTEESGLSTAAKEAFFNAKSEDIVVNSFSPTGYPMRMLRSSPALAQTVRPNCEAYGYLLSHGDCPYLKEWREREATMKASSSDGTTEGASEASSPCMTHGCLCTHMRNYKVWTCGATTSRLHETSVQREDGSWIQPKAAEVYEDYLHSEGEHIELPQAAKAYLQTHPTQSATQ